MSKPVFRRTEIGDIPTDWGVRDLQTLCRNPITYGIVQCGPHIPDGIPYIRVSDMQSNELKIYGMLRTSSSIATRFPRSKVEEGDIVYALRGKLGEVRRIPKILVGANLTQGTARISPSESICAEYLIWAMRDPKTIKQAELEAKGTTFREITLADLRKIKVATPPMEEQEAIAEALSDADTYIESLEQLIAKKRLIKQGVMQELLTGERRLPGFSGEWRECQLGKSAILKARIGWQGLTTSEYKDSGDYYLVTGTEFQNGLVDWDTCHHVDKSRYAQDKNIQLSPSDILVTKDGTIGKVALVHELPKPATLNSGVFVIRPINGAFHPEFFYYLLSSSVFTKFLNQLSAGSTINHLYQKDFVYFRYMLPKELGEQRLIAQILADIDHELKALGEKLIKAQKVKQGMMQELLTGRIRLV